MRINEIESTKKSTIRKLLKKYFEYEDAKITIDNNGLVSSKSYVEFNDKTKVGKFPVKFFHVGEFWCADSGLTSLQGSPESVVDSFTCSRNQLTSLEGGPQKVGGSFYCSRNQLTSLNGCAQIIGKSFSCTNNNLTSLEGGPKSVGEIYNCFMNPLATLKGLPDQISGMLSLTYTPQLPLMRTLVAKEILFSNRYESKDILAINKLMNIYAGQGKAGMMKCSSELLTLGKELGLDLRQNARW